MQAVQSMGVEESVEKPGTADIADNRHLFTGKAQQLQGPVQAAHHRVMTAARTKNRRPFPIEESHGITCSSISFGLINSPFIRP